MLLSKAPMVVRSKVSLGRALPQYNSFTYLYERVDGLFRLELFLPEDYPMAPPKVRFLTKIYHPNIGASNTVHSGPWSHRSDVCDV